MKTLISSAPTIPELEKQLSSIPEYDASDKSYTIERHGNRYNCYQQPIREGLDALRDERNRLMVSKGNPKRLAEVIAKIDWIEYGIK